MHWNGIKKQSLSPPVNGRINTHRDANRIRRQKWELLSVSFVLIAASVRVRAAEAIFNHAAKTIEIEDIYARVEALEAAAGSGEQKPSAEILTLWPPNCRKGIASPLVFGIMRSRHQSQIYVRLSGQFPDVRSAPSVP
jgi:hypothetical protein